MTEQKRNVRLVLEGDEAEMHSDDKYVMKFANFMLRKMEKKRNQGYGGWDDPDRCSAGKLSRMLIDHLEKGDPVDVANFAMMIFFWGGGLHMSRLAKKLVMTKEKLQTIVNAVEAPFRDALEPFIFDYEDKEND